MPHLAIDAGYLYLTQWSMVLAFVFAIRALPESSLDAKWTIVSLGLIGAVAGFTFIASEPPRLLEDFRAAYLRAGAAVLIHPQELISELQRGVDGFVNLPIVAYLFAPFAAIPGRTGELSFTLLGLVAVLCAWYGLCTLLNLGRRERMLLLLLFAAWGPLHNSVKEGNTSHFVLLLLVGALTAIKFKRDFLAGAMLGLASIIKLPLLLFAAYALLRRRWNVLAGGATVCTLIALFSLLIFGWSAHVAWYVDVLAPYSEGQVLAFNVQSVRAFLGRLISDASVLTSWDLAELPSFVRGFGTLISLSLLAFVGLVVARPISEANHVAASERAAEIEFSLIVLLACIVSPLSWSHYYCWLLVPAALLMTPERLNLSKWSARAGLLAVALALPPVLMPPDSFGRDAWFVNLGVSHLLIAACIMIAVLLRARMRLFEDTSTVGASSASQSLSTAV